MKQICVLMASYNRKATTLRALEALDALQAKMADSLVHIHLLDDNSPDGTAACVRGRHPSVSVIDGTGQMYWAGGMNQAFKDSQRSCHPAAYLLLNDDVELNPTIAHSTVAAFERLNANHETIVVGSTVASDGNEITYSGLAETSRWRLFGYEQVPPNPQRAVRCDTFNANFVLIPSDLMRRLGGVSARYSHTIGDLDLGLRARSAGAHIVVAPVPIGVCDRGPHRTTLVRRHGLRERLRLLFVHPYGLGPELWFAWQHHPRMLIPLYAANGIVNRLKVALSRAPA